SGLPLHDPRNDTTISCSSVVRLIRRLDWNLEQKYQLDLADIMMISGVDTGATYSDGSKALVVKSGTLNGVKNLAGAASTTAGEVYFGVFLEGRGANGAGVSNVVANLKSNYTMKRIQRSSFAFDPLEPDMGLRVAAARVAPVAIRQN
ncbi:MAG: hypothetical protein V4692_03230, partial [Bdellovibrionota bacterium]